MASPGNARLVQVLAEMHADCATFLRAAGQSEQAMVQSEKARALTATSVANESREPRGSITSGGHAVRRTVVPGGGGRYKEYLAARPGNTTAVMRRGIALLGTESVDEALTEFRRAATLEPRNARAQWYLTIILLSRREVAAAAEHAVKFVALAPDDPEAHDLLGRVWASQGKLDAAQAQFEKALQLNPGYEDAREHLKAIGR